MIIDANINDLYAILVHKIYNKECINLLSEEIIKKDIYKNSIKTLDIQHLLCNLKDVPHISYVNSNKRLYINYMINAGIYAGFGLEHSFEKFDKLIKDLKYLENPYEKEYIKCRMMFGKLVIIDGLHRASILKTLNNEFIKIELVK